jgi:hypothetical protein
MINSLIVLYKYMYFFLTEFYMAKQYARIHLKTENKVDYRNKINNSEISVYLQMAE